MTKQVCVNEKTFDRAVPGEPGAIFMDVQAWIDKRVDQVLGLKFKQECDERRGRTRHKRRRLS